VSRVVVCPGAGSVVAVGMSVRRLAASVFTPGRSGWVGLSGWGTASGTAMTKPHVVEVAKRPWIEQFGERREPFTRLWAAVVEQVTVHDNSMTHR
jgi:hypothetical protein